MSEESKLVYSSEWKKNQTKYSLSLTEDEWVLITCTLWLDHQFEFAEKIEKKLKNKYPEIYLGNYK